jgi:hypothetical protein
MDIKPDLHPRPMTIGRSAYERSFDISYIEEEDIVPSLDYNFRTRVIPKSLPYGLPAGLCGKSVAVVGNGVVTGSGSTIDSHDEVIRISGMRSWRKSKQDDGVRTTLWSGHLAFVIDQQGANPTFAELVEQGVPLWTLSPFHITCDAFLWLRNRPVAPQVLVLPAAAVLFDVYHQHMSAIDMEVLFSIPPPRRQLTGLSRYECLLTGTRLVLALEACGVSAISLYGFDLFANDEESVWFGHDLKVDLQVLQMVRQRLTAHGKAFHWTGG